MFNNYLVIEICKGEQKMKQTFMNELLRLAPFSYAYHKLVLNDRGEAEDYIFLEVNPAFEEMTGLKRESILGKRVTEVLPGIRTGGFDWVAFYGKVALTGERQEFTQYSDPLGRWYKITAFSLQKEYFVTIFHDITFEMKNIDVLTTQKKEIETLSNDLEIIFNSTHDAMFLVGVENGKFYYIRNNAAHQKLTGLNLADFKDKTPIEIFGKETGKILLQNYIRCIDAKKPITYENNLAFPAGEIVCLTTLTPVLEKGMIKYLVGSSKDITLQKKAEEERNALLLRFRTMLNEHTAVMLLVEPITGQIVDANPAACAFYGYTMEGHPINIAHSAAPIKDEKGQTFGVVMVFRDVSKEKNNRNKLFI